MTTEGGAGKVRTEILRIFDAWSSRYPEANNGIRPFEAWKALVDDLEAALAARQTEAEQRVMCVSCPTGEERGPAILCRYCVRDVRDEYEGQIKRIKAETGELKGALEKLVLWIEASPSRGFVTSPNIEYRLLLGADVLSKFRDILGHRILTQIGGRPNEDD